VTELNGRRQNSLWGLIKIASLCVWFNYSVRVSLSESISQEKSMTRKKRKRFRLQMPHPIKGHGHGEIKRSCVQERAIKEANGNTSPKKARSCPNTMVGKSFFVPMNNTVAKRVLFHREKGVLAADQGRGKIRGCDCKKFLYFQPGREK